MKSLRTSVAAAVGGAVLVAGLLVGASVAFADETDVPDRRALAEFVDTVRDTIAEIRENRSEVGSLEALTAGLGIDLDEVISTIEEKVSGAIDEHVEEGHISEERAEMLRDRLEAFSDGAMPFFDRPFHQRDQWRKPNPRGFLPDGVDFGELREMVEAGTPLDEALEELGFDLEEALDDARAMALEHLDRLVEAGRLDEERAAELKERIESFVPGDLRSGPPGDRLRERFGDLPRMREFFDEGFSFEEMPSLEEFLDDLPLDEFPSLGEFLERHRPLRGHFELRTPGGHHWFEFFDRGSSD